MSKMKSNLVDSMEYCIECGSPYAECHHVFFGSFQKKYSDIFKFYLPLCAEHHRGKEEDFLAEGCAMIGTILTMVEVKYGEEEREEFLNIAMETGRKEIEQIMKEISEEPKEDKLKNRRDFINGDGDRS